MTQRTWPIIVSGALSLGKVFPESESWHEIILAPTEALPARMYRDAPGKTRRRPDSTEANSSMRAWPSP